MRSEALEAGLDVTQAAPLIAAGASLARDTYRALTADGDVIAVLAARYVQEKPGTKTATTEQQGPQAKRSLKERVLTGLAKVGWWSQIVERTAVKAITEKGLEQESHSKEILEFINSRIEQITAEGETVEAYLSDRKRIRADINTWLKERKVTDRTAHLIETFRFLTDAKTLNNYRDLEVLQNFSGTTPDEALRNFEALRETLHDIVLKNLYGIKNLNKNKFNGYIDQLTQYR